MTAPTLTAPEGGNMTEEQLEQMGLLLMRRAELDAEFRAAQPEYTKHRTRCNGLVSTRQYPAVCIAHTDVHRKVQGLLDEAIENAQAIEALRQEVMA